MSEILLSISDTGDLFIQIGSNYNKTSSRKREYKGTSVNQYVDNYCIVDLETTGVYINSLQIIEISAIQVRNNQVVAEYSTLVNPQCHIPEEATKVNHITDDMVKDAPILDEVIDDFLDFIGDNVIIGYNNASFDMNIIYDKVQDVRCKYFTNDYIDILYAAKRSLSGLENFKLETVSKYYGLDVSNEHRALTDCYLTNAVYQKLYNDFGDTAFQNGRQQSNSNEIQYSTETFALRELQKLLQGFLEDRKITRDEVYSLNYWLAEHRDLEGIYPFDKIFKALDDVLEDGQITEEELTNLKSIFLDIIDPVKNRGCHKCISSLVGKNVCLTGEFEYGSKSDVNQLILSAGGNIDQSVKKTTDYLIVGAWGNEMWKAGSYGAKIQKAMENKEKGQEIEIYEEKDFIPVVTNLIENGKNVNIMKETSSDIDWKVSVQAMLDKMVLKEELPENSLYLMSNIGRDGMTITSYSICIYEPDYPIAPDTPKDPTRNSIILNIKEKASVLELIIEKSRINSIGVPQTADVKELKSDNTNIHIYMPADSLELTEYIQKNVEYAYENYTSKASAFGCCGKFNECSDAKKCIHVNKLYSKACTYRKNLEAGRIFYGKNRNIH